MAYVTYNILIQKSHAIKRFWKISYIFWDINWVQNVFTIILNLS